ncbi:cytochrome P450 [Nocardia speluncae]|nr:cytochrome P450 [Nocardia speluncae]
MRTQMFSTPIELDGPAVPIYTPEFAADPHAAYREMRRTYGSLVPVEIQPGMPATLVIGYREALEILNDHEHFSSDPRTWQAKLAPGTPVSHIMQFRPCALRLSGSEHTRLRQVYTDSLSRVDLYGLHTAVERTATGLINSFCETGSAELVSGFSVPLSFQLVNHMLGFSLETGQRLLGAIGGIRVAPDAEAAEAANQSLITILLEELDAKRGAPADDVTSWMMAHPAGLADLEVAHQVVMLFGSGVEPMSDLIINSLVLLVTDPRFADSLLGGALSIKDAIEEVLFTDPPLANFCIRYPRQPQLVGKVWLPANQPVIVSSAAVSGDPAIVGMGTGDRSGNRSHLAWGAGPHVCPAQDPSFVIGHYALEQLLDALPEIELAQRVDELSWRVGGYNRALDALPVRFPPTPPIPLP